MNLVNQSLLPPSFPAADFNSFIMQVKRWPYLGGGEAELNETDLRILDARGAACCFLGAAIEDEPMHELRVVDCAAHLLVKVRMRSVTQNDIQIVKERRIPPCKGCPACLTILMSLRSTLIAVLGSMMVSTASTAIGEMISAFWLTTLSDNQKRILEFI